MNNRYDAMAHIDPYATSDLLCHSASTTESKYQRTYGQPAIIQKNNGICVLWIPQDYWVLLRSASTIKALTPVECNTRLVETDSLESRELVKANPVRLWYTYGNSKIDLEDNFAFTMVRTISLRTKASPGDNVQAMIDADYEVVARLQAQEQEELTIEEKSKLFVELMDNRKKHFARLKAE
ncbi:hypothetical protein Tco_0052270 [Tanacetum coccineum]